MKQYLLLLRSSDFTKSGNIWTSNPINVYNNSSYKNYSYKRSLYGLNVIGDRTFVGTELTSPSHGLSESTPFDENAIYATNYGEIVYDEATPELVRFIDTSSRVDVLSYKHVFTNISGTFYPTFNLQIFESDNGDIDGPWLKSSFSADSNSLFIQNVKPYIKVELEIYAPEIDLDLIGLVFYLELGIYNLSVPVISQSAKNILRRFPSWTALYEDSLDLATPEIQIPQSTGGKFISSLVQESLDDFQNEIDKTAINSYINSADTNMLSWIYSTVDVPVNIVSIKGDGVSLARASSLLDFFESSETDYIYYYSIQNREVITTRYFEELQINDIIYKNEPRSIFNDFDEFGARVSLPRLYLESNENYKKRILDVTENLPEINIEGFKRTLRRELDIWRAYGATPDSDYLGATPEVLEISDIESSIEYFDYSGKPLEKFEKLVEDINSRYPSNLGYVKWGEGTWDYAGVIGEGVNRIPAIYDASTSPLGDYYQGGVGDFNDAQLLVQQLEEATVSFNGGLKISGLEKVGEENFFTPIDIHYSWYLSYLQSVNDFDSGRRVEGIEEDVGVAVVYEITMPPHDNYATPTTLYTNLNYKNRDDFFVGNRYSQNHSSYPEFNYIKIIDQDGNTLKNIEFKSKDYDEPYLNTEATPYSTSVNIYQASEIKVVFDVKWEDGFYQEVNVAPYRIVFDKADLSYYVEPIVGDYMTLTPSEIDNYSPNFKIGSTVYLPVNKLFNSTVANSTAKIKVVEEVSSTDLINPRIRLNDLIDTIIYPPDATPQSLYINADFYENYPVFSTEENISARGGLSNNILDETTYLIPSSPNITWTLSRELDDSIASPAQYFDSATINDFATPFYMDIQSELSNYYPFTKPYYEPFVAETNSSFYDGFIDEINNTYKDSSEAENYYINQDKYLDSFIVDKSSFGLDENTEYIVSSLEISTTPQFVRAFFDNADQTLKDVSDAISDNEQATVNIYAERDEITDAYYLTGLHNGWVYVDQEEYYIYSKPITEIYNGKYFDIDLQNVPRLGYPILVKVNSQEYRNILFEDSATPGKISFINTEVVKGNKNNTLYLAYQDLLNIEVVDTYSGKVLFTDLSTETGEISPFNQATPAVYDREYEVTYTVDKAFYVDKDVYFEELDQYKSVIHFSATPDTNSVYSITYEKDYVNNFMSIDLNIDQVDNPLHEGYIYISKDEYNFGDARITLSPTFISDSYDDFMSLSIVSYDENHNLKPGQTFRVYGNYISANPEYVTTNDNGLGVTLVRYNGPRPSDLKYSSVMINGVASSDPNGAPNSLTDDFTLETPFKIKRSSEFNADVKAVPVRYRISADGKTDVPIVGRVYWRDQPITGAEISLRWNKAQTLYDLFDLEEFNYITTDVDGKFVIQNEITAQNNLNPSSWFVRIEIADEEEFFNQLESSGEVLGPLDVTISGDIVYWYEEYDNIHYANEQLPMGRSFGYTVQLEADYLATPTFRYDHPTTSNVLVYPSNVSFEIPRWVNLRRYDQYQMGILGSTVDDIEDYDDIHPDFGDT